MLSAAEAQRRMRALPLADLGAILGGRSPLVLAPHPDDESLGCGGFLAECSAQGLNPFVLVLTDGVGSHPNSSAFPPARLRAVREAEGRKAVGALGLGRDQIGFLRLPDTKAPSAGPEFGAAVAEVMAALVRHGSGALLSPWRHDPHCDHWAAHLIAVAAARRLRLLHVAYPVWGWTLPPEQVLRGPAPAGWRIDIARHLPAKRRAIKAHASQTGSLITDDPSGFRLPPNLLVQFDQPYETFLSKP